MSAPYKLCAYCGWGVKSGCTSSLQASSCALNLENVRKFYLRNKSSPQIPQIIVKSTRYQGAEGKGDSFELLEIVE